jgi:hypothetical protein
MLEEGNEARDLAWGEVWSLTKEGCYRHMWWDVRSLGLIVVIAANGEEKTATHSEG